MYLIVGLGNPGVKYLMTRHNIGYLSVDHFARSFGNPPWKEEHKAMTCKFKLDGQDVLLAKPQTYMNLSGESVQALMSYYKIDSNHLLVIHDDIDQEYGRTKFQRDRGAGGHNGVKDITEKLSTQDYPRLKLGVGRPTIAQMDVANWVLQNFSKAEEPQLAEFLEIASDAIECFIFESFEVAANKFNRKGITAP